MNELPESDYDAAGVEKLRVFTENVTGGRVSDMSRQVRWRPAWFATVEKNGETSIVYIRGDRQSDVMPFPELRREADILEVLHENGIPVPRIYGVCEHPQAIVMESLPGERDIANAGSDDERSVIVRQYIEAVARMHRLPVAPFIARGLDCPATEQDVALAGVNAYMPLYRRTKAGPEPLIEFALRWLRENIPAGRNNARLVQFDSGQYHFADGQMTGLYDFEFAMLADPLADLATMRMRESVEPLGEELAVACRYYEEFTGEPIDHRALAYHTLVFATAATMQFAGTIANPHGGAPHAVYLEFDLALRRTLILTLADCLGADLPELEAQPAPEPRLAPFADMLADMIAQFDLENPLQRSGQDSALQVVEFMRAKDAYGAWMDRRDREDAATLLGRDFGSHDAMLGALEDAVVSDEAIDAAAWFQLFAAQEARKLVAYRDTAIAGSALKAFIPPSR